MLHAITTIGQHPRGLPLHLRNLRWALAGCEHRIHVQTFEEWGLHEDGVTFVRRKSRNPLVFHDFWGELDGHLASLLETASAFLLMQQDILFTEPVRHQLERCAGEETIVLNLESPYLSVFREDGRRIYPRIWEGATFLPRRTLADLLEQRVTLGHRHSEFRPGGRLFRRFQDLLESHWTTKTDLRSSRGFERLVDVVRCDKVDTMVEPTLYFFCSGQSYLSDPRNFRDCELGASVVHLRNPEAAHRDLPEVYRRPELLKTLPHYDDQRLKDCVLMYFLSGVIDWRSELLECLLDTGEADLFAEKVGRLGRHAGEWMSPAEHERFEWVRSRLESGPAG